VVRRLSLLLVALMAFSLVPVAASSTHRSEAARAKKMTITILSQTRVAVPHDLAPKGKENKGDWIRYRSLLLAVKPLWGKRKNEAVGWEVGTQTYTNATDARVNGKSTFPGQGTIQFRGVMKSLANGKISVPIVGGTGKFSGAKGVLIIGPGQTVSVNTYRLTFPDAGIA
jgi:hypothetical protein